MEWNYGTVVQNEGERLSIEMPEYPLNDGGFSKESFELYRCRPCWYIWSKRFFGMLFFVGAFLSLIYWIGKHLSWN
jgi:hypothetical protein